MKNLIAMMFVLMLPLALAAVGLSGCKPFCAATPKPPEGKDVVQKYEFYRGLYDDRTRDIDELGAKYKTAEAAFKKKYTISRPATEPRSPKKPVGLTVALGGAFATMFLILVLAPAPALVPAFENNYYPLTLNSYVSVFEE